MGTTGAVCRIQSPVMARSAIQELSDDFSLPDYKPEIRRMISVTAAVSPAAHYLTPGHAEFAGSVKYCIQYEGGDGVNIGFTKASGRTLVSSASRDGHRVIAVVLNDGNWFQDAYALMDYGFAVLETSKP